MKIIKCFLVLALVGAVGIVIWHEPFYEECSAIRKNALRLHIVANSDSEADQTAKLLVRDAVLEATKQTFSAAGGKQEAQLAAAEALALIEASALSVLRENGLEYTVHAYLCESYFKQLSYGEATLPAGNYTALRVELGAADGANWWCVMYPPLCVMAACEDNAQALEEAFGEEEASIVLGGETYAVRFKIEELFQLLLQKLRGARDNA